MLRSKIYALSGFKSQTLIFALLIGGALHPSNAKALSCKGLFRTSQDKQAVALSIISSAARQLREIQAPKESPGGEETWVVDGPRSAADHYNHSFTPVYEKQKIRRTWDFIERFLQNRRNQGESNHVLDLFGSAFFVEDPRLADSRTGIRFKGYARDSLPENFSMPTEVLGDVFNPKTWRALDLSMKERSIPAMDFVAMRPVGGWRDLRLARFIEGHALGLKYVLGQVLARLSPTGRFYFEIPLQWDQSAKVLLEHKTLTDLVERIEAETPYKLILVKSSYSADPFSGRWEPSVVGALVPK